MSYRKPLLLSPVGKAENLYAALEAGADAVYLGFQKFNARGKASNFNISDLYSAQKIVKKAGKKLYLVLNTLIKEGELDSLYRFLQIVSDLRPDALIIQDPGMLHMVKHKTDLVRKGVELHASTQFSTFNEPAVSQLEKMGFSQVVVDRHLTLDEVAQMKKVHPELKFELFVHGAMCYGLSGSCYFSSYLGGLSANRGLCAQVCRRKFKFGNNKEGYLFSLSDLDTLEVLDKVVAAGVDTLKIEGRMKSPEYVYNVTKGYRYLMDNLDNFDDAYPIAREYVARSVSRRATTGFYVDAAPKEITDPFQAGVFGTPIGRVARIKNGSIFVQLTDELNGQLRARLHSSKNDETVNLKIKKYLIKGEAYDQGLRGDQIELKIEKPERFEKGAILYLIEQKEQGRWSSKLRPSVKPRRVDIKPYKPTYAPKQQRTPKETVYIKLPDKRYIPLFSSIEGARFILPVTKGNVAKPQRNIIYSIPFTLFQKDLPELKKNLKILQDQGQKKFEITSFGNLDLIQRKQKLELMSAPSINVLNQESLDLFKTLGVERSVLSFEITKRELQGLAQSNRLSEMIVPIYAKIKLFISRAPHPELKHGEIIKSSRNEPFIFRRNNGVSYVFSARDFSLTKRLKQLREFGYHQFYLDLESVELDKLFVLTLVKAFKRGGEVKQTGTFNYFLDLK